MNYKKIKIYSGVQLFMAIPYCVSCGVGETKIEKALNDWAEKQQSDFYQNITYCYHDFYNSSNLFCNSEAEAVAMWSYGPGFEEWGTEFHRGKTAEEIEKMQDRKTWIGIPNKSNPKKLDMNIHRENLDFRMSDFHYLDDALQHSTAGEGVTVYHGSEYNEYEMIDTINTILSLPDGKSILDLSKEEAEKIDLDVMIGKTIIDYCWVATTFNESYATGWANFREENNSVIYHMHLAPDVKCAYTSYSRKKYFDGIYLAWPFEQQLLTERNLKFKINKAWWQPRDNGKGNFLVLDCYCEAEHTNH